MIRLFPAPPPPQLGEGRAEHDAVPPPSDKYTHITYQAAGGPREAQVNLPIEQCTAMEPQCLKSQQSSLAAFAEYFWGFRVTAETQKSLRTLWALWHVVGSPGLA